MLCLDSKLHAFGNSYVNVFLNFVKLIFRVII